MMNRNIVRIHGLPPFVNWRNASGIAQGGPADASAGLSLMTDDRGTWAWNTPYGQWMLLRTIRSGDTLWAMSGQYYGERTMAGVHLIGNIEQNRPILGASYDKAVPGDVILIPDLTQPGAAPPSPGPPAAQPPADGSPVPGPDEPPLAGGGYPIPELPAEPPPGWPATMPWPPLEVPSEPGDQPPGELPGEQAGPIPTEPVLGAPPVLVGGPGAVEPAPAPNGQESWWTTTRIALVGGLGLATVGLIVWGATRGSKRRRRRSSSPRRRRRRR